MYFRERLASETNICSLRCFEASVASHSCIQFAQDVMWLKALDQASKWTPGSYRFVKLPFRGSRHCQNILTFNQDFLAFLYKELSSTGKTGTTCVYTQFWQSHLSLPNSYKWPLMFAFSSTGHSCLNVWQAHLEFSHPVCVDSYCY